MSRHAQRILAASPAAIGLCAGAATPAAAASGFVEADRTRFEVDGRPWRPIGYNQYRLTSQPGGYVCDTGYGAISDASLGRRLDEMRDAGANSVRTWFFQSDYEGGGWAPFDRLLRAAAARGMRVMYDPQLERFIDPVRDAQHFAEAFDVGVRHVQRVMSEGSDDAGPRDRPSLLRRVFRR